MTCLVEFIGYIGDLVGHRKKKVTAWEGANLDTVMAQLDLPRGLPIVVAVDGTAVPRDEFAATQVPDGATILITAAVGGG